MALFTLWAMLSLESNRQRLFGVLRRDSYTIFCICEMVPDYKVHELCTIYTVTEMVVKYM